jgi:hypothetical protein
MQQRRRQPAKTDFLLALFPQGTIYTEFGLGDAISARPMQCQLQQCDFSLGLCDFSSNNAISV